MEVGYKRHFQKCIFELIWMSRLCFAKMRSKCKGQSHDYARNGHKDEDIHEGTQSSNFYSSAQHLHCKDYIQLYTDTVYVCALFSINFVTIETPSSDIFFNCLANLLQHN